MPRDRIGTEAMPPPSARRDTAPGCARRTTQRPHRRRDASRHGQGGGRQPWRRWSICRTNTALGSTTCRITSKDRDWLTSFRPSLSSISRSCRRSIRHAATAATESGGKNRLTSKAPYTPAPAKAGGSRFACPECGVAGCPAYDSEDKTWRHLNFFQHEAYLHARVPRVSCKGCGIKQVLVPWARPDSGFTLLFEALVMAMVQAMPVAVVARMIDEWDTRLW